MLAFIGVGGTAVALLAAVWMIAYRMGFREGRESIPLRMIAAVSEHRVVCEGQHPDHVIRELVGGLRIAEPEARRMVTQVRDERTPLPVPELRTAS